MSKKVKLLSLLLILPVSLLAMKQDFSFQNSDIANVVKSTFKSKLEKNEFNFERSLKELEEEISGNISGDWRDVEKECLQKSGNISCLEADGVQLASGSEDCIIRIWSPTIGTCLRRLKGHSGVVNTLTYSPDGSQLASGSFDRTIKIWDPNTGKCLQTLSGHTYNVFTIAYSPDGSRLATSGLNVVNKSVSGNIKIWNLNTGECLHTFYDAAAFCLVYSSAGNLLVAASPHAIVNVCDLEVKKEHYCFRQQLVGHMDQVNTVACLQSCEQLASGSNDKTIKMWNPDAHAYLGTLIGHSGFVNSVAYSPDGKQLASGSHDRTIKIWNPRTEACLQTLKEHKGTVYSLAYSPNGGQLVSGSEDKTVKIWDSNTGVCLRTLEGHKGEIYAVAYSPLVNQQNLSEADDASQLSQEIMPRERFERSLFLYASELLKEKRDKKYSLAVKLFACSLFDFLKEGEQKQLWNSVGE